VHGKAKVMMRVHRDDVGVRWHANGRLREADGQRKAEWDEEEDQQEEHRRRDDQPPSVLAGIHGRNRVTDTGT
jgi:hypothetical protein